ncbi:MAG: phosphate signaling complex protein PhoU [Defluviitaleaceae bacterium]|nr:phosphate signaling complex protein PhoU [Defluviitaleaceae bacterium]
MRGRFDKQLEQLNDMLLDMGAHIEKAIAMAKQALLERDIELAKKVSKLEDDIDQKEKDIEGLCMKLLLQQQPVARDLRLISAALKMLTDMERIGDQASDIAEIVAESTPVLTQPQFAEMADAVIKMVMQSVEAFVKKDLQMAKDVIKYDDVVDGLFESVKVELIELIRADATSGEQALDLLMVAKYFERIGDHAVNIAKWARYSIAGRKKSEPKNSAG